MIRQINSSGQNITLHPNRARSLGLIRGRRVFVSFGQQYCDATITTNSRLNPNTLLIPSHMLQTLMIPQSCPYELQREGNLLRLGPFTGLLVAHSKQELNNKVFKSLMHYVHFYKNIGGAIIAFSLDGVNTVSNKIKGYYYNPVSKSWRPGEFGLPTSFMIKSNMIDQKHSAYFRSIIGSTFFNDFNLNKWQTYKLLEAFGLGSHLPRSSPCMSPDYALTFLEQYKQIYLKPVYGSRGKAIFRITKIPAGAQMQYREAGINKTLFFYDKNRFIDFISGAIIHHDYMLQRAIDLPTYKRRIIDFRIVMTKNKNGKWESVGQYARFGTPKSVVSNLSAGGRAEQAISALKRAFHLSEREAQSIIRKMTSVAFSVARCFDGRGLHCGNMGVDIGIDRNRKLWIIEVQHNNPSPGLLLAANDDAGYFRLLNNNMQYMKWLSGF